MAGYDVNTGDNIYISSRDVPEGVHLQDFNEFELKKTGDIYDYARDWNSLTTLRKKGTSKRISKLQEKGDPNYRIPKPDHSFILQKHPSSIE